MLFRIIAAISLMAVIIADFSNRRFWKGAKKKRTMPGARRRCGCRTMQIARFNTRQFTRSLFRRRLWEWVFVYVQRRVGEISVLTNFLITRERGCVFIRIVVTWRVYKQDDSIGWLRAAIRFRFGRPTGKIGKISEISSFGAYFHWMYTLTGKMCNHYDENNASFEMVVRIGLSIA